MELKEKITLDMLTKDSVSVLRQQFLTFNGEEMQVGGNIRNAYMNDESGREQIRKVLSDEYYNAVMAVWGDTLTVDEPIVESENENNAD
jgi:hypothetical protein